MNITELQEKLKKLNINVSARRISQIWGMDEASFSRKKRVGSEIKYENILQLEQEFNINLTSGNNQINVKPSYISDDKFINIPYWEFLPEHLKSLEVDYIPVQRKVIEVGWKLQPEALRIVPMVGDKMSKYWYQIGEDDLLIIDTNQNEILGNGVYFATSQNNTRLWVREMQNLINNDVQIKGYALSGETVKTFTRQQLQDVDFRVIGKVIKNVSFRL